MKEKKREVLWVTILYTELPAILAIHVAVSTDGSDAEVDVKTEPKRDIQ